MIDWSLPVVTLPECSDPAALEAKFWDEWHEFEAEPPWTMASLMELWDCYQVTVTWGILGGAQQRMLHTILRDMLDICHSKGLPVQEAKERVLIKNATRPRPGGGTGYYSEEDCQRIIAGQWGEK